MAKKTVKKAASPATKTPVSKAIALRPTAAQAKAAEACLSRSGKIQIGFKQVSVTKLPKSIAPVAVFVD